MTMEHLSHECSDKAGRANNDNPGARMSTEFRWFTLCRYLFSASVAMVTIACNPSPNRPTQALAATASAAASSVLVERDARGMPKRYSVVAYGYNYTDTYIDSFEVDGAGGGNLEVSDAAAGGGGHTCCATLTSGLPLGTEFVIKWTRDRKRWCEQTAKLTQPIPIEPRYLEVHFYPDGHIEVEATQRASSPRLKLDRASYARRHETGNITNDEKFSRCKDGY